jgi:hypothetical protein
MPPSRLLQTVGGALLAVLALACLRLPLWRASVHAGGSMTPALHAKQARWARSALLNAPKRRRGSGVLAPTCSCVVRAQGPPVRAAPDCAGASPEQHLVRRRPAARARAPRAFAALPLRSCPAPMRGSEGAPLAHTARQRNPTHWPAS